MNPTINQKQLDDILNRRLVRILQEKKRNLPPVISKSKANYFTIFADQYFLLAFVSDAAESQRIKIISEKGYHPFPGLIADKASMPAAFSFKNRRNVFLMGNSVENMCSLSLGEDSTVILCDHKQSINTAEFGVYSYVVQLAYIVSFGKEINHGNMYDFLEDSIAYSIKKWFSSDEE